MRDSERRGSAIVILAAALAMSGCGGGTGMATMLPISVSLNPSIVTLAQNGAPVHVAIAVQSTSETALVNFTGLPAGVKVTYAASDTSPSGLLTFTATASSPVGTTMPIVTVNSAGQTASIPFTLIVSAAMTAAATHQPSTYANTSGATIDASDSMMYFGVFSPSLPHVIFSLGTAPEYDP